MSSILNHMNAHQLPLRMGRYLITGILGEGGMARVYRAVLHGPGGFRKPVAIKVLRPENNESQLEDANEIIREAIVGGLLRHPNLVDVYELGQFGTEHFIAMELVDGVSLRQLIKSNHFPPPRVLLEIAIDMAAGLEKAHAVQSGGRSTGLVHRDLKPSNVLISWDGAVKIVDFGVAFTDVNLDQDQCSLSIQGTPPFMAPEQARGTAVDGRTDLFSMGLVLLELSTGHRLFKKMGLIGLNPNDYVCFDGSFLPPDIRTRVDSNVDGLGSIIHRCLAVDPNDRPQNAATMIAELETLFQTVSSTLKLRQWIRALKTMESTEISAEGVNLLAPTLVHQNETLKYKDGPNKPSEIPTNIAPSMDTFIGREDEISTLLQLTESGSRLITLKGLGGAGKTRLSRTFAHHCLSTYIGGAWFVDLTEARSAKAVMQAVCSALEVPMPNDAQIENSIIQLGRALAGRGKTIVVLDNFEQVVKRGAPLVSRWLALAPEVVFLVTSREPLHIGGETVVDLQPLNEKQGVALLQARAEAAGARWADSEENTQAIIELVRRLDGIPLAIEMAAARAVHLGPRPLLERVSQHLSMLSNVRRDQHVRQSTLGSLLDWSWHLLEPWEQAAFAQLSVFKGGFSMEGAEAILDLSPWPEAPWKMDVIGSLIDKSLLRSWSLSDRTRFGMYWTVQEYALGHLQASDSYRQTRLRHAAHFSTYGRLEAMNDFRCHGGFARASALKEELENFIAGIHTGIELKDGDLAALCAIALETVVGGMGFPSRILEILKQAIQAEEISDLHKGRLVCRIAGLTRRTGGDQGEQKHWLDMAVELAKSTGAPSLNAQVNIEEGLYALWQGNREIGHQRLTTAIELSRAAGIHHLESLALRSVSTLKQRAGDVAGSLECLQRAREIAEANGDELASTQIHSVSAGGFRLLGNTEEAQARYMEALTLARRLKLRAIEGIVIGNLANLYTQIGQLDMAYSHYEMAMKIATEVGNVRSEAICCGNMGALVFKQGDLDQGARMLIRAIQTQDHIHPSSAGAFRSVLAMIRAKQGDIEEARRLLDKGEQQIRGVDQEELGLLLCSRGEVETIAGERTRVEEALKEAEEICALLNLRPESQLAQAIEQLRSSQK